VKSHDQIPIFSSLGLFQ
jgi:hypothetical protein